MVCCSKAGFNSQVLNDYVNDKLCEIGEKNRLEGFLSYGFSVLMNAFESAEVQAAIEEKKVWVNVPETFARAFKVSRDSWKAEIPFDIAMNAIEKEISRLCEKYGWEK